METTDNVGCPITGYSFENVRFCDEDGACYNVANTNLTYEFDSTHVRFKAPYYPHHYVSGVSVRYEFEVIGIASTI